LYAFFFLKEWEALVWDPQKACWFSKSTQAEEGLSFFYQMHEFYNEIIAFAPVRCQESINKLINEHLKRIKL
jgi:hypothetical protein